MEEFSVCLTDPLMIDIELFNMWLEGKSDQDMTKHLSVALPSMLSNVPLNVIALEVKEQITLFTYLEQFLYSPQLLNSPLFSTLSPALKEGLVRSFYSYDSKVIREILGKKMGVRLRKEMDEVSEKSGVSLSSCQRQFDNIKNILKTYEDTGGSIMDVITKVYMLEDDLARQYQSILFLFQYRFETLRKKVMHFQLEDFIVCADAIIRNWTVGALNETGVIAELGLDIDDIDVNFIQDLREVRNFILEKDIQEVQKCFALTKIDDITPSIHFAKTAESNFKSLSRNIFMIGASLSSSKDFKDFFLLCVEKVIEPCKLLDWSTRELDCFFTALTKSWSDLTKQPEFATAVLPLDASCKRFLATMRKCLLQLYK